MPAEAVAEGAGGVSAFANEFEAGGGVEGEGGGVGFGDEGALAGAAEGVVEAGAAVAAAAVGGSDDEQGQLDGEARGTEGVEGDEVIAGEGAVKSGVGVGAEGGKGGGAVFVRAAGGEDRGGSVVVGGSERDERAGNVRDGRSPLGRGGLGSEAGHQNWRRSVKGWGSE
jgi:hypothetical protein